MRVLLVLVLLLFGLVQDVFASDPKGAMRAVWNGFVYKGCEQEEFVIESSRWYEKKYGLFATCRNKKTMLFMLNRIKKLKPRADGVLLTPDKSKFGFLARKQKKEVISRIRGSFDYGVNGTLLNVFDLAWLLGEDLDDYSYKRVRKIPYEKIKGNPWHMAIQVTPLERRRWDYSYRIIYIKFLSQNRSGLPAIVAVEYYCRRENLCKVKVNQGLHLRKRKFWRPRKILIWEIDDGKAINRNILDIKWRGFFSRMRLDRDALRKGRPLFPKK